MRSPSNLTTPEKSRFSCGPLDDVLEEPICHFFIGLQKMKFCSPCLNGHFFSHCAKRLEFWRFIEYRTIAEACWTETLTKTGAPFWMFSPTGCSRRLLIGDQLGEAMVGQVLRHNWGKSLAGNLAAGNRKEACLRHGNPLSLEIVQWLGDNRACIL